METTMNADELRALAERVQGLDGPDREVDARIWCALNGKKYAGYFEPFGVTDGRFVAVEYTEPPKRTRLVTGGKTGTKHALRFTASLDAAMALVPDDHSDGPWLPCIESDSSWNGVRWRAQLGHYCYDATESCYATTPALALTAAALLARASMLQP
jgi:hypothetical protein